MKPLKTTLLALTAAVALAGCSSNPAWMSSAGPTQALVLDAPESSERIEGIVLLDVNDSLARNLSKAKKPRKFSEVFPPNGDNNYLIGPGDIIEVSVWEAPPAMLFGAVVLDPAAGATTTRVVTFPEQMVTHDGQITMPFAGGIQVTGRTTHEIQEDIRKRLRGKANEPQVLVRVIQNNTSNVTVVGEVNNSTLMPLTPKGERLLDALAAGGGTKESISRTAVQLSRNHLNTTMPLELVIRDPQQNIKLKPGDVVTALYQSQSFSVMGATGKNEEIQFEAQGISLAQALARSGGLQDNRADARGVFVFRFEDAKLMGVIDPAKVTADGTVPVVYQVNLRDPASLFVTQNFPIQNSDVIFVSNSPEAEFSKFLRLVVSVAVPSVNLNRMLE